MKDTMYSRKAKQNNKHAIRSRWWRRPLEALFPDKTFDGQFQNPGTGQVFDFDDRVILAPDPFKFIEKEIVYSPPGDEQERHTIFIPGLGQTKKSPRFIKNNLSKIICKSMTLLHFTKR